MPPMVYLNHAICFYDVASTRKYSTRQEIATPEHSLVAEEMEQMDQNNGLDIRKIKTINEVTV